MFFHSLFPKIRGKSPRIRLVTADNQCLVARRAVLAAHCQNFHLLPQLGARGRGQTKSYHLHNISSAELKAILWCLQSGNLYVHSGNILHLLMAANKLGIPTIYAACYMYVQRHLRPENVVAVFQCAQLAKLPEVAELARSFLGRNFAACVERCGDLWRASDALLTQLLWNVDQHVDDGAGAEFVERWAQGQGRRPSDALCQALGKKNEEGKPKTQANAPPSVASVQEFLAEHVITRVLFVLGGEEGAERLISVYNPALNIWTHLQEIQMPYPWTNMAAIFRKGFIYLLGGDSEPDAPGQKDFQHVARLSLATLQWRQLARLREERFNPAAVLVDDTIFVMGGADMEMDPTETMEWYVYSQDRWQRAPSMPEARTECGAVTSLNKIYVVGGYDSEESLDTVLVYDVENRAWQPGPPMPAQLSSVRAALVGRRVFVPGGNQTDEEVGQEGPTSSCYCLDLDSGEWSVAASMQAAREFHCVAVVNGRVVVVGEDGVPVESLDPATNTWSQLGLSQRNRTNGAACTVPLDALGPDLTAILENAWMQPV